MYRTIASQIEENFQTKRPLIVVLTGLRQTGKSTLVKSVSPNKEKKIYDFEILSDRQKFLNPDRHELERFANENKSKIVIVDEVQKLPEATSVIKYLYDHYNTQFILTRSSEYKIKRHLGDSLVGRIAKFSLYPLNIEEIVIQSQKASNQDKIDVDLANPVMLDYLVYGTLPGVLNVDLDGRANYLQTFAESLLSKDVLDIANIYSSTKILALAKFLAMQIGQLVNVNELANLTELGRSTVYNYLDILEQINLICRAYPLSTNDRQAISEKFKVYFVDLGLRNALVSNFSDLGSRLDGGNLLENAVYMGMKRQLDYQRKIYQMGFFRSRTGSELDIVLKQTEKESLFEVKMTKKFSKKKGNVEYITMENAWKYLL